MASHLNPPNRQSHVCKISQLIRDIRHANLTRLLFMKVEIYQPPTLPMSLLQTSSPTSGGPLAPSGSLTLFSKIPCVLHSKIEWHPLPKIVHLPHSATACGNMEQLELHTLHIHHVHACVCLGCACVCLCALIEQWLENRNTLWRSWDKGWCIARLVQCHGYESYGEIKDCEISRVIAKEVIQDGLVSALLTLNTCLH